MSTICNNCRDLFPSRTSIQDRYLHPTASWWQEFGATGQCCNYPINGLEMGILVIFYVHTLRSMILTKSRIVAMIGGFCWILLFLFVPETFWDRTPRPRNRNSSKNNSRIFVFRQRLASSMSHMSNHLLPHSKNLLVSLHVDGSADAPVGMTSEARSTTEPTLRRPSQVHRQPRNLHVGFSPEDYNADGSTDVHRSHDEHISLPCGHIDPLVATGIGVLKTDAAGES